MQNTLSESCDVPFAKDNASIRQMRKTPFDMHLRFRLIHVSMEDHTFFKDTGEGRIRKMEGKKKGKKTNKLTAHPSQRLKSKRVVRKGRNDPFQTLPQFLDKLACRVGRKCVVLIGRELLRHARFVEYHEHRVAALHQTACKRGHRAREWAVQLLLLLVLVRWKRPREGEALEHAGDDQRCPHAYFGGVLRTVGEAGGEGVLWVLGDVGVDVGGGGVGWGHVFV